MYAVASKTRSLFILLGLGLSSACGGSEGPGGESSPDAREPDARPGDDGPEGNPLDAFSAASKAYFHLVPSGRIADGTPRVFYAPRVMYLDAFGSAPRISALILTSSTQERRYQMGGMFSWGSPEANQLSEQLQREATSANLAVIRADLGLPHVACGLSDTLLSPTFFDRCDDAPRIVSFGFVSWQGTQRREVTFDVAKAAVDKHLADGGAWDDVLAGDIAWHTPGGEVLHTKLEISCVGQLFDANDNPVVRVFDSPTCRARYPGP
jgi:hypothetical protein